MKKLLLAGGIALLAVLAFVPEIHARETVSSTPGIREKTNLEHNRYYRPYRGRGGRGGGVWFSWGGPGPRYYPAPRYYYPAPRYYYAPQPYTYVVPGGTYYYCR